MSDLIDRQAVIDLLKQMRKDGDMVPWEGKAVFARIRKLPTIQPEKAQLSQEGTTKDTISRQAALEKVRTMQTYKLFVDDDMILVDKAEVQTELMMLPPAQPDENDEEFIKLTARYSNGRPYYSIIYLEYDKNGVGHDIVGYSSYSLDVISDYLKKYFMPPAQPEPQWIPVSERLPETGGEYLVSVHHTIGAISVLHPEKDTYVDDVAIMRYYGKFPSTVRAWMPLPEAYKPTK